MSPVSSGLLFSSGTITADGNSGWFKLPGTGEAVSEKQGFMEAQYTIVPSGLTTNETVDVTIEFGYDDAGVGGSLGATFAQITSTNAEEAVQVATPKPPYARILWDVGGTTPSMAFSIYHVGRN